MFRRFATALVMALLLQALPAQALQIAEDDVIWGFDGRVVPGRINLLSVRVMNNGGEPFEGQLELHRLGNVAGRVGAVLSQPCYVTPFTDRWVQFHVYIANTWGEWELPWGPRVMDRVVVAMPRPGPPAQVLLETSRSPLVSRAPVKSFPADLFPPTVCATEGLHGVLLDGVPRWEASRRQAFREWLTLGGTVVLLRDTDGQRPVFGGDLAYLDFEGGETRVGAGRVVFLDQARRDLTPKSLPAAGLPALKLEKNSEIYLAQLEDAIYRMLRVRTRGAHNWLVIYALIGIYLCGVGPFNGWIARKYRDYRIALLLFLSLVLVFAGIFSLVGRRGYGERASVHGVAVARALGGGVYDVTQWCNAFVTRSGAYTIAHAAPNNLYATAQESESIDGVIQTGAAGRFDVQIPLYSSMSFLHRARLEGPRFEVFANGLSSPAVAGGLRVRVSGDFPSAPILMWAYHDGRYFRMQRRGDELVSEAKGMAMDTFLPPNTVNQFAWKQQHKKKGKTFDPAVDYEELVRVLCAREAADFGLLTQGVRGLSPGADIIRLFVFAEAPAAFGVDGTTFEKQALHTLYVQDAML